MPVLLDARPVSEAIKNAVGAVLDEWSAYDIATIPGGNRVTGDLPRMYALVHVERRFDESARRFGSPPATTCWRVTIGGAGTTVRESAWVLGKAAQAIEDVWLTVTDSAATYDVLCRFESSRAPEWDDGHFYGTTTYTCAS